MRHKVSVTTRLPGGERAVYGQVTCDLLQQPNAETAKLRLTEELDVLEDEMSGAIEDYFEGKMNVRVAPKVIARVDKEG